MACGCRSQGLSTLYCFVLRQVSHQELTDAATMADKQAPRFFLRLQHWDYKHLLPCLAFMWVLGTKPTQVLILIWKTLCQLNSLPLSPPLWFCFVLKLLSFYRQVCIVNFVKHGKEMHSN